MAGFQVTNPERDLMIAVVLQAVEDLSSKDEKERFEACEFMFQERGGWAKSRRFYFDALGLDESLVQERLAHFNDPPERPDKKWTMDDVYAMLPAGEFRVGDIARSVGLHHSKISARLQHLQNLGKVIRVSRGVFVRDDHYEDWLESVVAEVIEPNDTPPCVLETLSNGPKTIREIGFSLDGEVGQDAIREQLDAPTRKTSSQKKVRCGALRRSAPERVP